MELAYVRRVDDMKYIFLHGVSKSSYDNLGIPCDLSDFKNWICLMWTNDFDQKLINIIIGFQSNIYSRSWS